MKNNLRRILSLVSTLILICGLSVTASAGGGPEYPVRDDVQEDTIQRAPDESTAENTQSKPVVQKPQESEPLTPEGNMTLVDDVESETEENKQFLTVVTKDGNYFYIIIDRAAEGENTVHFLNQVDEEDLLALMETEQKEETPIVCSCTEKCAIGSIKTDCEICMTQMSRCVGEEPEPVVKEEPDEQEPEPTPEKKNYTGALLLVVLIVTAVGAGAFYFLILNPKRKTNMPDPLEDFDLEEEYYVEEDPFEN